ncbi:uncharacterized protein LOC135399034 [Ornithodoros turicata]|uniref:uncharacterized protein LOC135399034 n=1 Tax=Ornithodoros turicata TaxID=34597 RepID=UPI00313A3C9B
MDGHTPPQTTGDRRENIFDIGSILQRHIESLHAELQQLVTGESRRVPSSLPEPYQWNQYLLDQDPAEWGRDEADGHEGGSKPSAHAFPPRAFLDETSPSTPPDSMYSSPPDFLRVRGPQTSTPVSAKPSPLEDPLRDQRKVLPIEYMGPHYFPSLKPDTVANADVSQMEGAAPCSTYGVFPPESASSPRREGDVEEFKAEYERVKSRLENRRRVEREALARLTSSESSSHPGKASAEKLRSSLNNLSLIIDEMADLMNIDVAEASASEVQERAEALWGREVAAQLSEEYSRDIEASKSEKSQRTAGDESRTSSRIDRDESKRRKNYLYPKAAREPPIRKSSFPLLGPRDIGYDRGGPRHAKGKAKKDRKGDSVKRMSPSSSTRTRTSPVSRSSTSPVPPAKAAEEPPKDAKVLFQSGLLQFDSEKRPDDEEKQTVSDIPAPSSVASPRWKVNSELQEGMTQQRMWRFEDSTNEDALDKMKQRRAEICRTTIGSLPPLQKVASVKLIGGPKKKPRKMCTLKIIGIVTPVKESTALSETDLPAQDDDVAPNQDTGAKSEPRWEAGFL